MPLHREPYASTAKQQEHSLPEGRQVFGGHVGAVVDPVRSQLDGTPAELKGAHRGEDSLREDEVLVDGLDLLADMRIPANVHRHVALADFLPGLATTDLGGVLSVFREYRNVGENLRGEFHHPSFTKTPSTILPLRPLIS